MTLVVRKWPNSLDVRIRQTAALHAGLVEGTRAGVAVEDGAGVLRPADVPSLDDRLGQVRADDVPGQRGRPIPRCSRPYSRSSVAASCEQS